MSIYVEILIRAEMEALWERTQVPALHERWDLRFTRIEYLPRHDAASPQRFLYATRIGFGLEIRGEGQSVATREDDTGCRTSALKFWSADSRSLIREGSGYWQYQPRPDGIRFRTDYDYRTRFGTAGRLVDRLLFRPLLGWATAWSFDRLRLWLETGLDPADALRRALIHATARLALAAIWAYPGLGGTLHPLAAAGHVLAAIAVLAAWRSRAVLVLALGATLVTPLRLVPLTITIVALCLVALWAGADLPSARRCRRRREATGP